MNDAAANARKSLPPQAGSSLLDKGYRLLLELDFKALLLFSVVFSVILSEIVSAVVSLIMTGEVTRVVWVAAFIIPAIVATVVAFILIAIIRYLRQEISRREEVDEALIEAKEKAELASRAKSDFLANMSHELRTPLNAIIGFSEVIKKRREGCDNPKHQEGAEFIHESGQHLLELINAILDLSKFEAGKLAVQEESIDLTEVVETCLKIVKGRADISGINIETHIVEGFPKLRADRRMMKQILLNLLTNAIKFTGEGGRISIDAAKTTGGGAVLKISDSGIGIAPEDIPRVLESFTQIDTTPSRQTEGTGLGLPLTRALVELHKGSLELQSEVGKGTTAIIHLPPERLMPEAA